MTKVAFIADVHAANHRQFGGPVVAGLNSRARLIVETISRASRTAAAHGCSRLVVLGDLFDSARPSPPLVRAVGAALQDAGCPVPVLVGNHDRASDAEHDNAASPLGLVNGILVIEQPIVEHSLIMVPFMPGPAMDWLPQVMAKLPIDKSAKNVLCLHLGIWDDATPPYLRGAKDAVSIGLIRQLMGQYGIRFVIAGNWHTRRCWRLDEGAVYLAGSTVPVNFGDEKADGAMHVLTIPSMEHALVPVPGPRWATIRGVQEMLAIKAPSADGEHLFVKVNCELEELSKARALKQRIEQTLLRVSVMIVPDTEPVKEQARAAAAVARSAESFEAAISGYVESFPVAEPGTIEGVSRRLMEYRRGAG